MNELIIKLSTLRTNQVLIGSVITAFLYYLLLFDNGQVLLNQIEEVKVKVNDERIKNQNFEKYRADYDHNQDSLISLSEQLSMVSAQLPRDMNITEFIKTIDLIAQESNVQITEKKPEDGKISESIETLVLNIQGEGDYYQLVKFIYFVVSIRRIYKIIKLKVRSIAIGSKKLKFEIELASFKFLPKAN